MLNSILGFLDRALGPIVAIGFFGFMFWLFYWMFVTVPKRISVFFKGLEDEGYYGLEPDNAQMLNALENLVPPHPGRMSGGANVSPWTVRKIIRKSDFEAVSYIAMVNRNEAHVGSTSAKNHVKTTLLFFQERSLEMDGLVYVTPRENSSSNRWMEYFHASELTEGYGEALHSRYRFYSPEERAIPLPSVLEPALIEICEDLCRRELFCLYNGVNLLFCPQGWGMCPDNHAQKEADLRLLTDVFHTIDRALARA